MPWRRVTAAGARGTEMGRRGIEAPVIPRRWWTMADKSSQKHWDKVQILLPLNENFHLLKYSFPSSCLF